MIIELAVLSLLVAVWAVCLGSARVRRLHRLHRRLDAARAGLESALHRRAVAAMEAGVTSRTAGVAAGVATGLGAEREAVENERGRALSALDRATLPRLVAAELSDAERQVELARRVHNDAVRDTLGLRSRRMVRWLHLAGRAAMPAYFEIADPGASRPGPERAVGPAARLT